MPLLSPMRSAHIRAHSVSISPEALTGERTVIHYYWMDWKKELINDCARERAIVVHGAAYANPSVCRGGRLGRSFGCPALPQALTKPINCRLSKYSIFCSPYSDLPVLCVSPAYEEQSKAKQ